MKRIPLALVSIGAVLLASGCGGSGSSGGAVTPVSSVQITAANAPTVAKGAATPAQGLTKTGSTGASLVGVVVEPGAPRKSVMDIALAELNRVKDLKVPAAPTGVAGVIAGFPFALSCATAAITTVGAPNSISMDIQDTNNNGFFDIGEAVTLTFNACVAPNPAAAGATTTTNGTMRLVIDTYNGVKTPTVALPIAESVSMSFTNYSVVDTAPATPETTTLSGGLSLSINDNGTKMSTTMSGTSLIMTSTTDGAFTMKNFSIAYSGDSPYVIIKTRNYSFTVAMTTHCAVLGGEIVITTPTAFTGNGNGDPTAGVMVIAGKNNSTLTLTARDDGVHVGLTVDEDGAAGPIAPVVLTDTTWTAI